MASISRRYLCLLTIIAALNISICLARSTSSSVKKVRLDLYYESLCPYSDEFIVKDLPVIFQNGLIDIVDIGLYPWGNARLKPNNSFTCQHGPNECLLNTVEACAIDAWPKLDDHFPFIYCVEKLVYNGKYRQWETCFSELGLDSKPIDDCYKGEEGTKLDLKYAALTASLEPPHEYVPWVVVDGEPLLEDYDQFVSFICKAYKGPVPSACKEASFLREKINHARPVCYSEQAVEASFLMKIWSLIKLWVDQMF